MNTIETIACTSCGSVNRAPASKLAAGARPTCGHCHRPLFNGEPYEVATEEQFDKLLAQTSIPILVDFWAPWCGPCLQMAPHFKTAARALEPNLKLLKIDTERLTGAAARNGIKSIPTMILFANGSEIARQSGAMPAKAIEQWVKQQLAGGNRA
jgi:thioredoxin 2